MIDFSSFRGNGFPLASTCGGIVVKGLDLNLRVDGWSDGDIRLFRMGGHSYTAISDKNLAGQSEGIRTVGF